MDRADLVGHGIFAGGKGFHGSGNAVGHHYLMADDLGLVNVSENVACLDLVSDRCGRNKFPLRRPIERGKIYSLLYVRTRRLIHTLKRALDTVVYRGCKSRSELCRQRRSRGDNAVSASESRGLLIHLDRCAISVDLDYLSYKLLLTDTHDVEHIRVAHSLRNNERSGYFLNSSLSHYLLRVPSYGSFLSLKSAAHGKNAAVRITLYKLYLRRPRAPPRAS